MKKCWLASNSVCLAMGESVALNLMFENKKDHKLFFRCWKKYLGGMATLLNYHLSPTGWILLIKTKGEEEIKSAYKELRSKSKKAKNESEKKEVAKILSEHFRIFLSQYVRLSNARHKRRGTRVLQRFQKYILNERSDYEQLFQKLTAGYRRQPQPLKRYQADESQYDKAQEMKADSVWKMGRRLYKGMEKGFRLRYGVELISPKSDVLRKYLNQPKIIKPPPPNP